MQTIPKVGAPKGNQNARKHGGRDAHARQQAQADHCLYCACKQVLHAIEAALKEDTPRSEKTTYAGKQKP